MGNWWDGVEGHQAVIYDDFRTDQYKVPTLCRYLDGYPFRVQLKGSSATIQPRMNIITSNSAPPDVPQINRRLNVILTDSDVPKFLDHSMIFDDVFYDVIGVDRPTVAPIVDDNFANAVKQSGLLWSDFDDDAVIDLTV